MGTVELCLLRPERPAQVVHCPSARRTLHSGGRWEPRAVAAPAPLLNARARAGDGRYLLSNAKDQTAKLWDLRRMRNAAQHARLPPARLHNLEWDYRCAPLPRPPPPPPLRAPPRPRGPAAPPVRMRRARACPPGRPSDAGSHNRL